MPIYEYSCGACGHKVEALQKLSDSPLTDCPACGKSRLSKLVSAAGFQLKGSGWYATDFKNSGSKPEAAKGNGEAKANGGEAKADSKTESKSETKSEASNASATTSGSTSGSNSGGCGSGCSCH